MRDFVPAMIDRKPEQNACTKKISTWAALSYPTHPHTSSSPLCRLPSVANVLSSRFTATKPAPGQDDLYWSGQTCAGDGRGWQEQSGTRFGWGRQREGSPRGGSGLGCWWVWPGWHRLDPGWQSPGSGPISIAWVAWICTSDFTGADPSSFIGLTVALHKVRGIKSLYSKLRLRLLLTCARYIAH